jgi:pimeloyl-ACP methyl ester carboxylesterase
MHLSLNGRMIRIAEPQSVGSEKGPSLFFVHGAGCDASVWDPQAEYFAAKHLSYRIDLPGHGASPPEGEGRISAYAQWVRLAVSSLFASTPFVLVGHSMGGAVVLEMAVNPPPSLAGIILVGTGAKLAVAGAVFQMLREDVEAFFQSIEAFAFVPTTPAKTRENFIRAVRRCPPSVIYNDFMACDTFDIRDRLEKNSPSCPDPLRGYGPIDPPQICDLSPKKNPLIPSTNRSQSRSHGDGRATGLYQSSD